LNFMTAVRDRFAPEDFTVPEGVDWLEVDFRNGNYPMPLFESPGKRKIPFVGGAKPTAPAPRRAPIGGRGPGERGIGGEGAPTAVQS
jgi:hypothetical protein